MKKILLNLSIVLLLYGCNNSKENSDIGNKTTDTSSTSNGQNGNDNDDDGLSKCSGISLDELKEMVTYWRTLPHPDSTIIQQISMDGPTLRSLVKKIDEFKLYTAAYFKDKGTHKKGEITLVIGLNRGKKWKYCDIRDIFYPISTSTGGRARDPICPPPDPCGVPFMEE